MGSCRPPQQWVEPRAMERRGPTGVTVFIDRDGVVNEEVHLLHRADQLRLLPRAAEGIRRLNSGGIPVIVVTNQSVVARGLCSESQLQEIHSVLQSLLNKEGAALSALYYCPHHEEADLVAYRETCPSRKPNTGMLTDAARRYGVDLHESFLIGDQTVDIQTGIRAGCRTVLLNTGLAGNDQKYQVSPNFRCTDLSEAAELILSLTAVQTP